MTAARTDPAALLRGTATGCLTAALAIAAHGLASGAAPTGAVAAQLGLLAATIGALASTIRRAADPRVLIGLLSAGQLLGHLLLDAVGHAHTSSAPPPLMLAAHVTAVVLGALMIAACERLCSAMSQTVRAVVSAECPAAPAVKTVTVCANDQPLHSALMLSASISHRGPPVGCAL
ncbi:hypothetical protein [Mycobacterium hubeiense]|uniref:hypothetical protein n=1 Tax=Mycobacterium hubeiense TaxID=1867256 RepID=UPI000C7F6983|nr:hypothetical protein [Mycobacterium sp. QGD 101]